MTFEQEAAEIEFDISAKKRQVFVPGVEGFAMADVTRNKWAWNGEGKLMYIEYSVELAYATWLGRLLIQKAPNIYNAQPSPYGGYANRSHFPGFGPF